MANFNNDIDKLVKTWRFIFAILFQLRSGIKTFMGAYSNLNKKKKNGFPSGFIGKTFCKIVIDSKRIIRFYIIIIISWNNNNCCSMKKYCSVRGRPGRWIFHFFSVTLRRAALARCSIILLLLLLSCLWMLRPKCIHLIEIDKKCLSIYLYSFYNHGECRRDFIILYDK